MLSTSIYSREEMTNKILFQFRKIEHLLGPSTPIDNRLFCTCQLFENYENKKLNDIQYEKQFLFKTKTSQLLTTSV